MTCLSVVDSRSKRKGVQRPDQSSDRHGLIRVLSIITGIFPARSHARRGNVHAGRSASRVRCPRRCRSRTPRRRAATRGFPRGAWEPGPGGDAKDSLITNIGRFGSGLKSSVRGPQGKWGCRQGHTAVMPGRTAGGKSSSEPGKTATTPKAFYPLGWFQGTRIVARFLQNGPQARSEARKAGRRLAPGAFLRSALPPESLPVPSWHGGCFTLSRPRGTRIVEPNQGPSLPARPSGATANFAPKEKNS